MSDAVRLITNYARAKRALNVIGPVGPGSLEPYHTELAHAEKELYLEGLFLAGLDHGKDCQCRPGCAGQKELA